MKFNLSYIFLLSILCFFSCKKEPLNQQTQKYLADYNEFIDTLTTYHPALYEFTDKTTFDKTIERLRNQIDNNTSKRELLWKLNEIITLAGDPHSSFGFFGSYNNLIDYNEYFPLQVRLIKNELVVIDPMVNKDRISKGAIIESVNEASINEIIKNIYKHIPAQAHITNGKKGMFNTFQDNYIAYSLNFPDTYQVKTKGKKEPIELNPISQKPKYLPMISPKSRCQKDFCLNEIDEKTVMLTLRTFAYYGNKTQIFKAFLDNSFKKINEKKYSNLIIDIRGNLGGTSQIGRHLLKHTLGEPFKFLSQSDFENAEIEIIPFSDSFNGKIFVLMNGDGFSSVGQLASIYKDKNRVTFIGETLGSNQFCTANQKSFKLTNTKFPYTVARNIFITAVEEKNTKATIEPDYRIEQSVEDFFLDKDVVLKKVLELIEK